MNEAVRARADGKMAVAERTVWQLDVGDIRIRCLRESVGFTVEIREVKGWTRFGGGPDPLTLLTRVVAFGGFRRILAERAARQ